MKFLVALCLVGIAIAMPPPAAENGIATRIENMKFSPKEEELMDALDIKWRFGFLSGLPFYSPRKAMFEGTEKMTYSFLNMGIGPGQADHGDEANWVKNDVSDLIFIYHYGAPVRIHLITEGGDYSTKVMGNPLDIEGAEFMVNVPTTVYSTFESLSNKEATFHSYIDIPAWSAEHHQEFTPANMAAIFPQYSGLFEHLAKPGYQGEWTQ